MYNNILASPVELVKVAGQGIQLTYWDNLRVGEGWEQALVNTLQAQGINAYRPCQEFTDRSLYRKQQQDVVIDTGRELLRIEVKSRNSPFSYPDVWVGCVEKWDWKEFEVYAIAVIDQNTRHCKVTPGSKLAQRHWKRFSYRDEPSYSIPKHRFCDLPTFIGDHLMLRLAA